ncbi:hypothetical protein ACSU64_03955 [Bacillaceae bacterium C204]
MSLTDFPTIKPTDSQVFVIALSIILFIFFFTERKESDAQQMD